MSGAAWRRGLLRAIALLCTVVLPFSLSAQILETETARPLRRGELEVGAGYEFQHSREGNETAVPLAFELGLTNRLGLLVEPVPYTAIRPKAGTRATGAGDLEVTLSYMFKQESGNWPALAFALEEKVPTARNTLIGTGKPDHAAYIIGSKRTGRFDSHANLTYTIVGQPKGQSLSNRISGALASEFILSPASSLYAEVLGSTNAGGGEGVGTPGLPASPEVSGDQIQTTIGFAHTFSPGSRFSFGISRDNVGAIQVRPGITLWFR